MTLLPRLVISSLRSYYAEMLGLLVPDLFSISFWLFFFFSERQTQNQGTRSTVNKKKTVNGLRGSTSNQHTINLVPRTFLRLYFLGPFPWLGKGYGPGSKVEHTGKFFGSVR